jgi:diguanylate cyclase (GGDEF)-like protein
LDATGLVGTPDDHSLDCITHIAAALFRVPVATISLIHADRQHFKSCVGLDVSSTARDISFCGHVVANGDPMIVEDALRDIRFADNPLVVSAPNIRFYAGYPVRSAQGTVLGTLCIIDFKPRKFSAEDRVHLQGLTYLVEQAIRSHQISVVRRSLVMKLNLARREAMLDPLLHVWNRAGVAAVLAEQEKHFVDDAQPFSVLLIDVDRFKQVNDCHGHKTGDDVLRMVVRIVNATLRSGDELGRFGGDEFLVVLPNTAATDAQSLARRLETAVRCARIDTPEGTIRCSISIGVAERMAGEADSIASLVHRADLAMLAQKRAGRTPVHVFSGSNSRRSRV